jgi:hypothetical protein
MPMHLTPGPKVSGMNWHAPLDWECLSKQTFRTRDDADRSLKRPGRRGERHRSRGKCEPYRCPQCNSWHVGAGL